MSFSISGKLCCGVDENFKPLLKMWICEGLNLTLDKFRTLRLIITSLVGFRCTFVMKKKISLTELLIFSSTCFRTSYISGTIMVCSFCWSLLVLLLSYFLISIVRSLPSCLCLYDIILHKNGCFFLLSSFKARAGVGRYFLSFLMGLFIGSLCELCWVSLLLCELLLLLEDEYKKNLLC